MGGGLEMCVAAQKDPLNKAVNTVTVLALLCGEGAEVTQTHHPPTLCAAPFQDRGLSG